MFQYWNDDPQGLKDQGFVNRTGISCWWLAPPCHSGSCRNVINGKNTVIPSSCVVLMLPCPIPLLYPSVCSFILFYLWFSAWAQGADVYVWWSLGESEIRTGQVVSPLLGHALTDNNLCTYTHTLELPFHLTYTFCESRVKNFLYFFLRRLLLLHKLYLIQH